MIEPANTSTDSLISGRDTSIKMTAHPPTNERMSRIRVHAPGNWDDAGEVARLLTHGPPYYGSSWGWGAGTRQYTGPTSDSHYPTQMP